LSILVQLPKFEGPIGLLLYLIRKEEMDIFDIDIHVITKQYFEFIKLMRELDLELAGEFIAMASTLIHIKSRLLLPQYDENGEVVENADPRKELVQKILEYQKYQEAAKQLGDRPWVGRDVWTRGVRERLEMKEEEIVLEENALFSLISSYRKALRSMKKKVHQVAARAQSIASRILEIRDLLKVGHKVRMADLINAIENKHRQLLITFLSILELGKLGFVSVSQVETYGDIYIEARKPIETDAITRVEEYDSINSEATAEKMIIDAAEEALQTVSLMDEGSESLNVQTAGNEEFELKDGFDEEQTESVMTEEIATDDEIAAAELELENSGESQAGDLNV
jgi:segregation and condensation protein A